jgi:hypothetical protein
LQKFLPFSRRQNDLDHEDIVEGIGLTMVEQRMGHPYLFLLNCTHISIAVDYQEHRHKESLRLRLRPLITARFQRCSIGVSIEG